MSILGDHSIICSTSVSLSVSFDSLWHVHEVTLPIPDLQPNLEHDVLLLVLRLWGVRCGLAPRLLECFDETDKYLINGPRQQTPEHVTLERS